MKGNAGGSFFARRMAGLTLIELVVVVGILAILATAIIPLVTHYAADAKVSATQASLTAVCNAIMGTSDAPGYFSDTGQLPTTIKDLFVQPATIAAFDRNTRLGWRGPYLLNSTGTYARNDAYGSIGDPAVLDAWGNPIILQIPTAGTSTANQSFARVVSAGINGVIDSPQNYLDSFNNPYSAPSLRGDDIVLFLSHSDSDP